ncbi:MAG: DUF885 family protein [Saprospiraceae bacterium]
MFHRILIKANLLSLMLFLGLNTVLATSADLGTNYIEAWKKFYPSKALNQGIHTAIFHYEDYSPANIQQWLTFNQATLTKLADSKNPYVVENRIDARLLKVQVQEEINKWGVKKMQQNSLALYTPLIAKATNQVLDATYLTTGEKTKLLCQRLEAVQNLCTVAKTTLVADNKTAIESGIKNLEKAAAFYKTTLPTLTANWKNTTACKDLTTACQATAITIQNLISHLQTTILPKAKTTKATIGTTEYARRLALYTDSDLTPNQLSTIALEEIQTVRKLIGEVSEQYLKKQYPAKKLPANYEAIVKAAFADMEKDAPTSGEDYLQFWLELRDAAIDFIDKKEIATLPDFQTLRIIPAPESAGPSARIGWVDSAPPFAPNPLTTLYLPSIPDTLPAQEQKDFWASFNKPFNRMIVIHELFPGHYMQIKISRATPHPIRLLFPYAVYFEGWATFTERVLLDAGWEQDNPLTFLAHLRKRLENANRAYTSMQVHCNDWTQDQVLQFSTETSLLAPQFAKSLWGRIMRSPMQLTSYFLGGQQFTKLLAAEKKRLGKAFNLTEFMDTIMQVGPIPIDEFSGIFERK